MSTSAALTLPVSKHNLHAYVSVDPGKHNGWATWNEVGDLTGYGTAIGGEEFFPWLFANRATKGYIVEKFTLFPWKNQQAQFSWNSFEVSQMIGAVKFVAFLQGVTLIESPPNIKEMAYKNSGIPKPSNKAISHQWDAVMHGYKYLMDIGVRKVGPL